MVRFVAFDTGEAAFGVLPPEKLTLSRLLTTTADSFLQAAKASRDGHDPGEVEDLLVRRAAGADVPVLRQPAEGVEAVHGVVREVPGDHVRGVPVEDPELRDLPRRVGQR